MGDLPETAWCVSHRLWATAVSGTCSPARIQPDVWRGGTVGTARDWLWGRQSPRHGPGDAHPLKVSTTTSNFMIGVTAAASAGVYLNRGYIDPGLAMPVMLGVLMGSM